MAERAPGLIPRGLALSGELTGEGDLVVEGRVEGRLALEGQLSIGAGGEVRADVRARELVVAGKLEGQVAVSGTARFEATAQVRSDVRAGAVAMVEGARFEGAIETGAEVDHER